MRSSSSGRKTPWQALRRLIDRKLFLLAGAEQDTVVLSQRRIYVLPSAAGLAFAASLLLMLIAAINYNLSLGYALIFVLAGAALVSTIHAYRNLVGLRIQPLHSPAVFAGDDAELGVQIDNPRPARRPGLSLHILGARCSFSLPAQGRLAPTVRLATEQRGVLHAGRTVIETRWPLGFIRAWTVLRPASRCIVYPRPEADPPPLPDSAVSGHSQRSSTLGGTDDFAGLSPFQRSDSPRHIAWKVLARGGPLMVKRFSASSSGDLVLDWQQLPDRLDTEQRLSRLCAWLLAAERSGRRYALLLPTQQFACQHGAVHLHACLQALALFGLAEAQQEQQR